MIGGIVSFLMSGLGQIVVAGVGALALWGSFSVYYKNKGRLEERAKITSAAQVNANKASKVRAAVDKIPDDKLIDRYFRD